MIKVNDLSRDFRLQMADICKCSLFGAYIESYMDSYGDRRYGFVEFWLHYENGSPDSAFCRYYDTLIFCGEGSIEARDFVRMLSPHSLLCSASCGLDIENMTDSTAQIMRLTGESAVSETLPGGYTVKTLTGEMNTLKDVYSLLCDSFPEQNERDFETFFIDNSHKIRHNTARIYSVNDDKGIIASTLSVTAISDTAAVIASIATREDLRRKGIAGAMLTRISKQLKSEGREVFLLRSDKIGVYEKCGFSVVGKAYCQLRNRSLCSLSE